MRALLPLIPLLLFAGCSKPQEETANQPAASEQAGAVKGVDRSHKGQPAPDIPYLGPDGSETRLTDYRGPVLVNFWATWCAPCIKELPTLNALSRKYSEKGGLEVVAINQDTGPQASIEAFYVRLKINDLGLEQDPQMKVSGALGVQVLPTTILFNNGKEVWRYVGDLDWTGPEAAKLLSEVGAEMPAHQAAGRR